MGLDMYAYAVEDFPTLPDVDFECNSENSDRIAYWRKHPDLHRWMEALYRKKGGEKEFNLTSVRLTSADLYELERAVTTDTLPKNEGGFFFGDSHPEDKETTLTFIANARKAIANGKAIYYDAWY
jgi:hypothetical protein